MRTTTTKSQVRSPKAQQTRILRGLVLVRGASMYQLSWGRFSCFFLCLDCYFFFIYFSVTSTKAPGARYENMDAFFFCALLPTFVYHFLLTYPGMLCLVSYFFLIIFSTTTKAPSTRYENMDIHKRYQYVAVMLSMVRFLRGVGVPHGYRMVKARGAMRHEGK